MTIKRPFLAVLLCVSSMSSCLASEQQMRVAMILGNEIAVGTDNGAVNRITNDGLPKSLPVWSKDGTHIAFVEKNDVSLAELLIIDTTGQVMSRTAIHPHSAGEIQSGMRYVESLEWLTPNRVAVGGTVNPSTTEYEIVDVSSQTIVKEFFDDGYESAFSPDGLKYAYVTGSPHFTPADQRLPTLNVNGSTIFSERGDRFAFTDAPHWSADGSSLAVAAINTQTEQRQIIVWHESEASASIVPSPVSPSDVESVFWNGRNLVVTSATQLPPPHQRQRSWVLEGGFGDDWKSIKSADVPNAVTEAEAFRSQLAAKARAAGGKEPDFWCNDCELTSLPRKSQRR